MILTVVGSGTLVPHRRRSTPALAVRADGVQITVDGGTGTLRRQAELGIDFRRTDLLLFTHIHPDHTLDLLPFLFACAYTPGFVRDRPVRIVGPRGFRVFVEGLRASMPLRWTEGGPAGLSVEELEDGGRLELGPLTVEARELRHKVRNAGYRFTDGGRTAAFTGDAAPCEPLVPFATGAALLVADGSGTEAAPHPDHLSAAQAADVAARAQVSQLVLTHLYPLPDERTRLREAAARFTGPIHLAADGDEWVV